MRFVSDQINNSKWKKAFLSCGGTEQDTTRVTDSRGYLLSGNISENKPSDASEGEISLARI